jgi:predicted Zn-ribbon and HTH transcriptional regulator
VRPFACRDCGFEFRRRHGNLSFLNDVCCQVEGRSLIRRNPFGRGVSEFDLETSTMRSPRPSGVVGLQKTKNECWISNTSIRICAVINFTTKASHCPSCEQMSINRSHRFLLIISDDLILTFIKESCVLVYGSVIKAAEVSAV